MSSEQKTKTAVVTGASRGIGKSIALKLASDGFRVLCISRSLESSQSVVDAINAQGGEAKGYAVDVSQPDQVKATCAEMIKEWSVINVLVNNAGITKDGLLIRMSDDDWNDVIQTNMSSCFHWTRELIRPMARARWGRIINIASVIGIIGNAGQTNYAAAKAGIIGMTKSVAREFAPRSVTANVVAPGFIDTDMTGVLNDEVKDMILKNIPMKRMGTPADISSVVSFIASEQSDYITGQVFTVDGGMVM